MSRAIHSKLVLTINSYVWDVLDRLHQPRVRFEIELFLATLCIKFPELTLRQHLMPRLRDCNTNPQTATSCLVLTAWVFAVMQKQIGAGDNTNLEVRSISPLPFSIPLTRVPTVCSRCTLAATTTLRPWCRDGYPVQMACAGPQRSGSRMHYSSRR